MNILVNVFLGLGGLGLVSHLLLTHGGEGLKAALIWIMDKYPASRKFAAQHGPDIISFCQSLEKGAEAAVEDAEKKEAQQGPAPRPTDV